MEAKEAHTWENEKTKTIFSKPNWNYNPKNIFRNQIKIRKLKIFFNVKLIL